MEQMQQKKTGFIDMQKIGQGIESIRSTRQQLNQSIYEQHQMVSKGNLEEKVDGKSKLDQVVEVAAKQYEAKVTALLSGLTEGLTTYTNLLNESKNFSTKEKIAAKFSKKWAISMRDKRRSSMGIKEKLDQMVDYSNQMYSEILTMREEAISSYALLDENTANILKKIAESQPREAELKEKLDVMEAQYKDLDAQCKIATPADQVKLNEQLSALYKELVPVRSEYSDVSNKYRIAQEMHVPVKTARNNFERMVNSFGSQASSLREKIENASPLYQVSETAVRLGESMKGAEIVDQSLNVATEASVLIIGEEADAIEDTELARRNISTVREPIMRDLLTKLAACAKDYDVRTEAIRRGALRSEQERYGVPTEEAK